MQGQASLKLIKVLGCYWLHLLAKEFEICKAEVGSVRNSML
jgi:hypothetical protein